MRTKLKNHLLDNSGSQYIEKLILIVIAFTVGGLLISAFDNAFNDSFKEGAKTAIENVYNW